MSGPPSASQGLGHGLVAHLPGDAERPGVLGIEAGVAADAALGGDVGGPANVAEQGAVEEAQADLVQPLGRGGGATDFWLSPAARRAMTAWASSGV